MTETEGAIVLVDYGAGNLRSVANAIARLGYRASISSRPDDLRAARAVILPGVGAAADAMNSLRALGLIEPLTRYITEGRPFLGVCLGLQVLLESTEEGGGHPCLGIVPGRVKRLPAGLKIPHMGWNQVTQKAAHPVLAGIPDGANFYFVHSYYAVPDDGAAVIGETDYGLPFCSVLARGNLVATQFHPEKSGEFGLRLYRNFLRLALPDS
ncbi:MAG: imidazole glycerol phosphate synthase subunit HisH [Chloroflexota bacterium]